MKIKKVVARIEITKDVLTEEGFSRVKDHRLCMLETLSMT
jgi:hypothetical protein